MDRDTARCSCCFQHPLGGAAAVHYRYLDKRLPFHAETVKRVLWQAIGSFVATLATLVAFVPVHFFNALWTNEETTFSYHRVPGPVDPV